MADIGQNEDFEKARQKAKLIGAKDVSYLNLWLFLKEKAQAAFASILVPFLS